MSFTQAHHIDEIVSGPVRDVFIRHNAQRVFSLYLSHRHHQVAREEAVAKVYLIFPNYFIFHILLKIVKKGNASIISNYSAE